MKNEENKKDTSAKSKLKVSPFVISVCILLILIPTAMAIFYIYFYDDPNSFRSNSIEVQLLNAEGDIIASDKVAEINIENSALINAFYNIYVNKKDTTKPSNISSPNFKFLLTYNESTEEFLCYFKEDFSESYVSNQSNKFFSVDEESYMLFLNSSFSESVYSQSSPPLLTTGDGETVLPTEASWNYARKNESIASAKSIPLATSDKTYEISGAINLSFIRTPDVCDVQIYTDSEELIYNGTLEALSDLKPSIDTVLTAKISAVWNSSSSTSSYGEAKYSFNIILRDKAEFYISKSDVKAGEVVIISVNNAKNLSKISYTPSTELSKFDSKNDSAATSAVFCLSQFVPSFSISGDTAYAAIPFSTNLPSGTFAFSVSYGAAEQSFTISVTPKSHGEHTFKKASSDISSVITDDAWITFESTLKSVPLSTHPSLFFRGTFGFLEGSVYASGYSSYDNVSTEDSNASFVARGNEYTTSVLGGTPVPCMNIGVVTYIGQSDMLGKYVVVDHGLGIRTWYCGLSDFNVSVGDVMAKGDQLGKSGSSPLVSGDGFLLLCTVNDIVIDTNFILQNELIPASH